MTGTSILRKSVAIFIAVAMVFAAIPFIGGAPESGNSNEVYADSGDGSSILFKYEVNGVVTNSVTKNFTELTKNTDMSSYKYLAWDGSKYKVYGGVGSTDAVSIDARNSTPSGTTLVSQLGTIWETTVTYGTVRFKQANGVTKEYSINDMMRQAQFPTNTGPTAFNESPAYTNESNGVQAYITTYDKVKVAGIAGGSTSGDTDLSATPASGGLMLITNLDKRGGTDYGYASIEERYKAMGDMPQNIVEITFVNSTTFNVFQQIGSATRTPKKSYSDAAFAGLAKNGATRAGFLQWDGSKWVVHGTDKYVKIQDLVKDAGLVFNAGDALLIRSSDMFSFRATYDTIQKERYFFGGTTDSTAVTANPTDVGAAIAVYDSAENSGNTAHFGSADVSGTAGATLSGMAFTAGGQTKTKRFFIGLSAANATAKNAPGNRFPNYVTEVTVIKDKADVITAAAVTGVNASYDKTGKAITPAVTVTLDGEKLVNGVDYTVTYGANTTTKGTVTITGKNSVTGTVVKNFTIRDKAAEKAAKDAKDRTAFKKVTPAAKNFKLKAGKKQVAVSWKKISAANKGYQVQYATNKKFTKAKTAKVAKVGTLKTTVKRLTKGKKYYVRVRGVAKIGTQTVYTKWSTVKNVKIK
jgi:hypothetical protein